MAMPIGNYFSKGTVQKIAAYSPTTSSISICLFYQYATPPMGTSQLSSLNKMLQEITLSENIGGRIRIAAEGLNCTLSGKPESLQKFSKTLVAFSPSIFASTHFKYIDDLPLDRAFKDLKILPVKELVFYAGDTTAISIEGGVHLEPKDFHEKLKSKNAVVIDVRNHYEADIGRFDKQGATYIDPMMRKSTDFPTWLKKPETQEQLKGKEILMYCTGGVRCEMASKLLKKEMKIEDNVFQLQGGIENYFKEFEDGGFWNGSNFVFDKREAFSVESGPAGVGGVVKKKKKEKKKSEAEQSCSKCCFCGEAWDRYIGKKKCTFCGVPVLMCDKCCTLKPDKDEEKKKEVRCPLCKKEGITVPVDETEFTNNGIGVIGDGGGGGGDGKEKGKGEKRAAPSVLKWGGGHGKKKKKREKEGERDNSSKPCKFGKRCERSGCWFKH